MRVSSPFRLVAFLAAWRDYEARYESVLAGIWLADLIPGLEGGEPSRVPKADLQWDVADDEAAEQSGAIEEAIEFAQFNADQEWRDFPEGFVERIQDGVAAWDRLERETGFDLRSVFRRRELIPFVLVPRQMAAKHGTASWPRLMPWCPSAPGWRPEAPPPPKRLPRRPQHEALDPAEPLLEAAE